MPPFLSKSQALKYVADNPMCTSFEASLYFKLPENLVYLLLENLVNTHWLVSDSMWSKSLGKEVPHYTSRGFGSPTK